MAFELNNLLLVIEVIIYPLAGSGIIRMIGIGAFIFSDGLKKTQIGSIGKNTSTVAISPLLVFSFVKNNGWPFASAAKPQAAMDSR